MRNQYAPQIYDPFARDQPALRYEGGRVSLHVQGDAATGFGWGVALGALAVLYLLSRARS